MAERKKLFTQRADSSSGHLVQMDGSSHEKYKVRVEATDRHGHSIDAITIVKSSSGAATAEVPKAEAILYQKHPEAYVFVNRCGARKGEPETKDLPRVVA